MRDKCGAVVEEIIRLQKIRPIQTLLRIKNVFDFMAYDSDDLNGLKQNVGFYVKSDEYQTQSGILEDSWKP